MITGKISYGEIADQEGKPRLCTSIIADDVIFFQSNQLVVELDCALVIKRLENYIFD